MQVQRHHLSDWGVSFEDALKTACDNLREISHQPFELAAPGVWVSPWRDNHDASRLVLLDLLRENDVRGELVAAVPNRDVLCLTGADNEEGLAHLANIVEQALDKPRPISGIPLLVG